MASSSEEDAELERMTPQLAKIIGFVEQLSEVDTDGVEPLANVVNIDLKLRKDEVNDGQCADKVLANIEKNFDRTELAEELAKLSH